VQPGDCLEVLNALARTPASTQNVLLLLGRSFSAVSIGTRECGHDKSTTRLSVVMVLRAARQSRMCTPACTP
jgi:hypothetical protein